MTKYHYSLHALTRIEKRGINLAWIEETLSSPSKILYLKDSEIVYFISKIEEFDDRYLKVVVNIKSKTIITVHFDRKWKRRIENENKNRQ